MCGSGSVFGLVLGGGYKHPPPVAVLRELGVGCFCVVLVFVSFLLASGAVFN